MKRPAPIRKAARTGHSTVEQLSSMQELIAAHVNALAEHNRLFALSDWGLVGDEAACDALDPLDDALVAICRARPLERADHELRERYLAGVLPDAMDSNRTVTELLCAALICEGDRL